MSDINTNGIIWLDDPNTGGKIAAKAVLVLNDSINLNNPNQDPEESLDISTLATENTLLNLDNKLPLGLTVVDGKLLVATSTEANTTQTITGSVSQIGTWNINLPTNAATQTTLSTLNNKIPSNLSVTDGKLLVQSSLDPNAAKENTLMTATNRLMPTSGTTEVNYLGTSAGATIKTSAGFVYNIYCCNLRQSPDSTITQINEATRYLQLFNSSSGYTNLIKSYTIYPNNGVLILGQDFFGGEGLPFSNGITWGISSTPLSYTPATANQTIVNIRYK